MAEKQTLVVRVGKAVILLDGLIQRLQRTRHIGMGHADVGKIKIGRREIGRQTKRVREQNLGLFKPACAEGRVRVAGR